MASYVVQVGRHKDTLPCATLHCTLWETLGQITLGYITLYKVGDTGTHYTGVRYTGTLWIWTNRSKSSWQPCCKCPETKQCQGICNHSDDFTAMECHMNHIDGLVPERRNSTALATQQFHAKYKYVACHNDYNTILYNAMQCNTT